MFFTKAFQCYVICTLFVLLHKLYTVFPMSYICPIVSEALFWPPKGNVVLICVQSSEFLESYESNMKQLQIMLASLLRTYCIFNSIWSPRFSVTSHRLHFIFFLPYFLNVTRLLCSVYNLCCLINVTSRIWCSCQHLCPMAYINNGGIDHNHNAECFRPCKATTIRRVSLMGVRQNYCTCVEE